MRLGMDVIPSLGSEDALERHTFFFDNACHEGDIQERISSPPQSDA
jgi:hypothetical protein